MNKVLVEKIRKIYTECLLEALSEVDVLDKEGNVLISKDLKVVHKDSGYEYTVSDIVKSDDGVGIVLRDPTEPRVEPQGSTAILDELDSQLQKYISRNISIETSEQEQGDIFIVDEDTFSKEYEVK